MGYSSKHFGHKKECLAFLKEIIEKIHHDKLELEEHRIVIPDEDLEFKVKYDEDPGETKFTIKVKWPNDIPEPDVPEEEEEEEEV